MGRHSTFNVAQKLKGKNGEPVAIFFVTGRYEDPFERLATVSDLVGDQNGDHAERCFKVPNPFYFIPGDPVPSGGLKCMAH